MILRLINAIPAPGRGGVAFSTPVGGEFVIHERNQLLSLVTELPLHYRPEQGTTGPSWLTTLGHTKDSLWSLDLFRCESILLKSHWVLVVMD